MAFGTLGGSANVSDRVESTIHRRGAEGSPIARLWTVLAGAGGALALVSLFVTWYAAARTANGLNSGWLPSLSVILVVAGAALLVAKTLELLPSDMRLSSELFTWMVLGGAGFLLVLRQLIEGDLHNGVYLLLIPLVLWTASVLTQGKASVDLSIVPALVWDIVAVALAFGFMIWLTGVEILSDEGEPSTLLRWLKILGWVALAAAIVVPVVNAFTRGDQSGLRLPRFSQVILWAFGLGWLVAVPVFDGNLGRTALGIAIAFMLWSGISLGRQRGEGHIEVEQVSLALASVGAYLVLLKRILDWENATGGWLWAFLAGVAVALGAFVACRQLGILSGFQVTLFAALAISTMILIILLAQVIDDGWGVLTARPDEFLDGVLRSQSDDDRLGISQGILGSFWIAAFVAFLAFPIGIAAAIYLEEYAPRDRHNLPEHPVRRAIYWLQVRLTLTLDIMVRNLAGVPSVVYGLLGLFLFVKGNFVTNWFIERINNFWEGRYGDILIEPAQSTLFAGGVTLAILVLPIVIITASEAVRAVPQSLREGAYGVGATKWEVIRSQVLPFAAPGILTGTLLALARAVGEAAPLILVGAITGRLAAREPMLTSVENFLGQFADRFTAMPIVIVDWVQETGRDEGFGPAAGAAIIILLVFVIMMNSVAVLLRNRFEKKRA